MRGDGYMSSWNGRTHKNNYTLSSSMAKMFLNVIEKSDGIYCENVIN